MLAVVVGLAITMAVPAMAADLTASGYIGISGVIMKNLAPGVAGYYMNTTFGGSELNRMGSYVSLRGRLGFNVRASEDLYGVFMLEMDSNQFGEWGATGQRNVAGTFGADRNAVEIKSVYVDFRIPPKLPVWARIGIQTYMIRPQVGFMMFDAAGVQLRSTINPIKLNITGSYAKMLSASTNIGSASGNPRDLSYWEAVTGSELYALDMNIPLTFSPKFSIKPGAFFAYQDIRLAGDSAGMGFGGTPATGTGYPINKFGVGTDDAYLYWLGAYLNGKLGPLPMELDFIYQGGKVTYTQAFDQHTTLGSFLVRGWISYVFKGLEVGGGGMYVQGENYDRYNNTNAAAGATMQYVPNMGARSSRFILPQPAVDAVPGDSIVYTGGWMGTAINGHVGALLGPEGELPGFWYLRGYAYYKLFDWMKIGAQLMYLQGTDRYNNNTPFVEYWNARHDDGHNGIGWEMDYGVNVNIYKNLSFNGAFGYLFAQKQMSMAGGVAPSDPWQFVGLLLYTF
jgi:hypothetical protein